MFPNIYQVVFLLGLACTSGGRCGWPMITFDGRTVAFSDRPLLISTWSHARVLFMDKRVSNPAFDIGYLDYAAIDRSLFSMPGTPEEAASLNRSLQFLQVLNNSGEQINFNRRVIIRAHGSKDGSISFEFGPNGERVSADNAYTLGMNLRAFFHQYKITVERIDLDICCNDSSVIVDDFTQGYKQHGDNVEIVGFRSKVGISSPEGFPASKSLTITGKDKYSIPLADYLVKGRYPKEASAQEYIVRNEIGSPPTSPEPKIREPGGCTIF